MDRFRSSIRVLPCPPGTGIGDRIRLDPPTIAVAAAARDLRPGGRAAYRKLAEHLRERRRLVESGGTVDTVAVFDARIDALGSLLRHRVAMLGDPVVPPASTPPPVRPDAVGIEIEIAREAARQVPIWPWATAVAAAVAVTVAVPLVWVQAIAALTGLAGGWGVSRIPRRRALIRRMISEQDAGIDGSRAVDPGESRGKENATTTASPDVLEREDVAALTALLEAEIADEDLPVPLVFDLDLDGACAVRLEIALPESAEPPIDRLRPERYAALVRGLTFRLLVEIARLFPRVETIEVTGTVAVADPATGHEEERAVLHLLTSPARLAGLDPDRFEPADALRRLGGRFTLREDGAPQIVEGIPASAAQREAMS